MYAKKNHAPILHYYPETPGSNRLSDPQGPCPGNGACPAHCQIRPPPLKGERLNHREVQLPRRKTDAVLPKYSHRCTAAGIRLNFFHPSNSSTSPKLPGAAGAKPQSPEVLFFIFSNPRTTGINLMDTQYLY